MIVSLSFGRWLALGGLLTIFVTAGHPALAQTEKKPASSAAKAKKKKPPVRAKKATPEPGDDLGEEEEVEKAPKPKKQTRAQKAKAEKEKKAQEKAAKAEKEAADKEAKAEKARAAKEKKAKAKKGKGKGKGKKAAPPPEEARIVVLPFDGPNGKRLRGDVVSSLSKVEGVADVTEENSKRENSADAAIALANEQQASAVLYGTASKKRGQIVLDVVMRNGTDGQVLGEASFKGPTVQKVKQQVDTNLPIELAEAIERAKPTPEPEPEPPPEEDPEAVATEEEKEKEEEPEAEEEAPAAAAKGRPSPLEIWLGFRGFDRDFSYNEDLSQFENGVAEQSTYGGPGAAGFLSLRWYPVAHTKGGFLSHLGLQGGYERGFLTRAKSPTGRELDVTYQEFFIGLRGRIPIAKHELGVSASYGQHEFTIQDDDVLLPDVNYGYLRPAVDGRFRFGKGLVGFSLGYRNVLSAGQIQDDDWFPNSDVGGIDAGLFGGYTPTGSYDLMAGFDMRRYYYSLNPDPGDPRVAGGAVDQYLGVWLGVAWRLAGSKD
ncbi:MAG TPA: hypothetical protein VI072_35355 [Polyangiaceae bacterium]